MGIFCQKLVTQNLQENSFARKIRASLTGLFKIHGIVQDSQKFVKHGKEKLFKKYQGPDFFTY